MFERNRILPEGQEVDISQIGLVDQLSDLTPGLIPAGTRVASYIFHADGIGTGNHIFEGSVTFDEDILGIIVGTTRLNNTDNRFGAVGTTYWNGPSRGLDLATNPGNDTLLLSVSRNTVSFRLVVGEAMDEFRVLTAVPTPGSFAVAALAAATTLRRRRSRAGTL
jgi:MYXO-CTERM domain-containing protein